MMLLGNINAIPFRRRFGGGDGTFFPSIPGMIARYSALSLTNEQMAENPVWKDLTGNGYDLQMKNFAWSGMSGVDGYEYNFLSSDWEVGKVQLSEALSYKITLVNKKNSVQLFKYIRNESENTIKITLKVTGIEINGCTFRVYDNVSSSHAQDYKKDGIYQINYTATEGSDRIYFFVYGGNMGQLDNPITIEQLPLYPGFILGDGVDDFAVTEKELNFEDTYTVYTAFIPFQDDPVKNMMMAGKDIKDFYMNYSSLNALSYYSGNKSVVINLSNGFNLLCCKRDADNMTIKNLITGDSVTATANEFINNPGLYYLWRVTNGYSYARLAIAGQTICNGYFSTDEDDKKVLDWYKKQYPGLFPDQAWTVTGKTNEDTDRATIANITGNGNNLVLSNFGFAENSGYGLYNAAFTSKSNLQYWSKQKIQFSKSQIETNKVSPYLIMACQDELSYNIKIKMTGFDSGVKLKWGFTDGYTYIEGDGIHVLNKKSTTIGYLHIEYSEDFDPDHVVTIEQIPDYEGYLVTDGVDDKIESKQPFQLPIKFFYDR